jgi:hypothetical protein
MLDNPMTRGLTTPERLAVLESLNVNLQGDVTEIKHDVKELATAQARLATELATKTALIATDLATKTANLATNLAVSNAADSAVGMARASTGVWVRAIVPWFLAGMGTLVTLLVVAGVFK